MKNPIGSSSDGDTCSLTDETLVMLLKLHLHHGASPAAAYNHIREHLDQMVRAMIECPKVVN